MFLLPSIISCHFYYAETLKTDWRSAAIFMDDRLQSNELVFFCPPYIRASFDFYSKRSDFERTDLNLEMKTFYEFRESVMQKLATRKSFWLISAYLREDLGQLPVALATIFKLVEEREFSGVKVYRYGI